MIIEAFSKPIKLNVTTDFSCGVIIEDDFCADNDIVTQENYTTSDSLIAFAFVRNETFATKKGYIVYDENNLRCFMVDSGLVKKADQ